ncbi:gliding motility-associated C-terminal domain-containing protein [Sediminibacterium sp.]|uniref:gliding motility-associated C-terminal domain-containing protein n=1 Tax=Sediminibacterium sp. TaxID=1917865 RepID=UPI00272EF4A7|nr:PKD domain-containing protein [Sediminibacterium sp.]MDP2421363.1 PKD domain-containing protein [Sediminibacterium sp.]
MYKNFCIMLMLFWAGGYHSLAQSGHSNFDIVENKGQWNSNVKFVAQINSGAFFLESNGFTVLLHNPQELQNLIRVHHNGQASVGDENKILHSHAYAVHFVGGSRNIEIIPEKIQNSYNNYFIGSDPSKWAVNCKIYQALTYKNVYHNIDVRYYADRGQLKYDLIIHPGGDISNVAMKYEGADKLTIKNRELLIKTSVGEVKELYPYSYQVNGYTNTKEEIDCRYEVSADNVVRLKIKNYSRKAILIVDPTLIFSTFTGSAADNWGFSATPGPDGSTFVAGIVFGNGFPSSMGAFQTGFQGGSTQKIDIGVMKLDATGSNRLYATYLGGSADEYPHSLIADAQGNLVVAGKTYSNNYPVTPGATVGPGGGADIIVTKLNAAGNGLIGSLRIGGTSNDGVNIEAQHQTNIHRAISLLRNYGDDSRSEVIMDAAGNIYLASSTQSPDFPVTAGVFQPVYGGGIQDGVLLKINPACNTILFSSFFGGTKEDAAFVLALNPLNNNIYVAGATASNDFPGNKSGVIQPVYQGGIADGFVSVVSNDGSVLIKTTYLGTNEVDIIYGIQFDKKGFPYVMGTTRGNWPVVNAAFVNPGAKQYVSKLLPDLSNYVYSTTFGTNNPLPNISPVAFLVDRCENVYISGWGGYLLYKPDPFGQAGTTGMPVTPDALKGTTDGYDFYFIVIKRDATQLLYATFFGQDGGRVNDHVDGGTSRYDANGTIYQAICANCGGGAVFPTTAGTWGTVNGTGGKGCNLAVVKIAFDYAGVTSGVRSFINNRPDSFGCSPLTIVLRDTVRNARSYDWSFGDGTADIQTTAYEVSHTYNQTGAYQVRLIAIDSSSCNIRDTSFITIRAGNIKANLSFSFTKLPPCQSLSYRFDNLSTVPFTTPLSGKNFIWDFGDGSRTNTTGLANITHAFPYAGAYKIRLILLDTSYCNTPDSVEQEIRIAPLVKARFETSPSGCVPYRAVFNNTSQAGKQFIWDFGDNISSSETNPVHNYPVGSYKVRLIAIDSSTCNITDTSAITIITVSPKPVAAMDHSLLIPEANKPVIFFNYSTGANKFKWEFGDGDSAFKFSIDTIAHQYNETNTYNASLIAFNAAGCTDTAYHEVSVLINPLLDVPNAFTPGRFEKNSILKVEGFGIKTMTFRIYNRWGQKVFETHNRSEGWDGTFNGAAQPMDVYVYTLIVDFTDGKKITKQGDITLIR